MENFIFCAVVVIAITKKIWIFKLNIVTFSKFQMSWSALIFFIAQEE